MAYYDSMLEFETGQWPWSGAEGLGHIRVDAQRADPKHPDALKLIQHWKHKRGGREVSRWRTLYISI